MNSEESRLRSFITWPHDAPVCRFALAANGFFATGKLLEAECNWCGCRFSDWEISDSIEERHRQSSPQCEFILNVTQCGNCPISITQNQSLHPQEQRNTSINQIPVSAVKQYPTLDLFVEKDRLTTFRNWPNPNITPQSLAKAGFFYRNRLDEVECAWCKGVIAQWEIQDNAFDEHRRFFPECPRVQLGPLIEISDDGVRGLGIQQISPPKNPNYSSLHARLDTYSNWPISDVQKPEHLAQAGLYYQKVDDQVRCFHCNMGLRSWEKEDDPWFEHAKWYPMCEFVRLAKGITYIQDVQKLTRTVNVAMEEAMTTKPVKLALEMGIDANDLQNRTQKKILETGHPFETIEELLKAVFDGQKNINSEISLKTGIISNVQRSYQNVKNAPRTTNITCNVGNAYSTSHSSSSYIEKVDDKNCEPNLKLNMSQIDNAAPLIEIHEKLKSDRKFLEEENRKLKDARLCKVCLDEEVGVVYLPCGHLVTCIQCAPGVNQCPMCRTPIKGFVRTYLS